jgi:hypothetical protein
MSDNEEQQGGASRKRRKRNQGILVEIALWILLLKTGASTRERRRRKGQKPPSTGICGPINHGEDGHPWVWMEIQTIRGFSMMDFARQMRVKANFDEALRSFVGWAGSRRNVEMDLQVQALPYDLNRVNEILKDTTVGELSTTSLQNHARSRLRTINEIKRLELKERRVFIGVKLRDERSMLFRMLAQLMLGIGFSSAFANGNEDVIYADQVQEVLGKFENNHLKARLLGGMETAGVIQRCVYRGHAKLPVLADESGVINDPTDLHRLSNSVARDHFDMMEIFQDGESSFAAYMPVAKLPEQFAMSWLFFGNNAGEPVEVSARMSVIPLENSRAENARTLNIIDATLEDLYKKSVNNNMDSEIARYKARKETAEAEKARLDKDEPKVSVNACMVVSGDSQAAVRRNSRYVIAECARQKVVLEIDESNQAEIRRQTYPGARLLYTDYRLELFVDGMAMAMPHATSLVGNGGDMLGVVHGPESGPFLYAHRRVLKRGAEGDTAVGEVVLGPSGEGKSSFMVNKAIADAAAGMAAIFDEGKGDSKILTGAKLLVPHIVMDLSAPEFAGLLNPLYLGGTVKESRDLTVDMLWNNIQSGVQTSWKRIVRQVVTEELDEFPDDPDFERIVRQRLMKADREDPQRLAKLEIGQEILGIMDTDHSEVIFAKGKPWKEIAGQYVQPGQVAFVVYGHLTPPEGEKPDSTLREQERLALTVRDLITVIYYKFAMDPDIPVAVYKDEIQIDRRMGGSVSSGFLSRMGRSKGCTITLGGQLMDDPPEDFWANTKTIWLFRFNQDGEAEKAIWRLGYGVERGSTEWKSLISLMLGEKESGRESYEVIVKTMDDEIGLVALNQLFHEGQFVSNIEGVAELRRNNRDGADLMQLPYIRRVATPEDARAELVRVGVSPEVVSNPNGHVDAVDQWTAIVMGLKDDELAVVENGKLLVLREAEVSAPQLPMGSA